VKVLYINLLFEKTSFLYDETFKLKNMKQARTNLQKANNMRAFSNPMKELFTWSLLLVIVVSGCKKEHNSSSTPEVKGNMIISYDRNAINSRVTLRDSVMTVQPIDDQSLLKSVGTPPKVDLTKNYTFKLVAEVDPLVYNGNTLQATHVKIVDHYAFVTYNTRGDMYLGGLEVFDVKDIKNPTIIWQAIFQNTDISAVDYFNNKIYLAGATDLSFDTTGRLKSPAILEVLSLDANRIITKVDTIIDLSSFAGTAVTATENGIYAASGSNGYLKIFDHSYKLLQSSTLDNARAVDKNSNNIYVLQGQPGRVNVYKKSDNSFISTYNTGGANQLEAKSGVAASDKYIFAALNEGGVQMLNLNGTLKQSVPKPVTPAGQLDDNYVSNTVSLHGDLVLIANGEAGLYIGGLIASRNDSLVMLGKIQFTNTPSANFVDAKDSVIFVATGLGGLKILSISINEGVPPNVIPTKPCATLYSRILEMFPDTKNNMKTYDKLLFTNDTISKKLVLIKASEVYVTFAGEGAGWKNTLGYYTYNEATPPSSPADITKHVVFPNISGKGEGGGLEAGDMVQLGTGKFPAGTVISFYLVSQGFDYGVTVPGRYTLYSDPFLNINNYQQSLLFMEKNCGDIVMTFEDIRQDDTLWYKDNDFNDIIFTISDSKDPDKVSDSFDLTKVPKF